MGKIDMAFDAKRIEFISRACDILRDMEHHKVQEILATMIRYEEMNGKDAPELKKMHEELDRHIIFWDIGMEICAVLDDERKKRMGEEAKP